MQPLADDPFSVLGLPRRFDVTEADVERAWLRASASLHPDRAGAVHDPDAAARVMARVNHARRVLADPELRAEALLVLLGGPSKEQDKTLPPGFLARIMAEREEIEEALTSGGETARAELAEAAHLRLAEHERRVAALFAGLSTPPRADALGQIRVELNAWRYAQRMLERVE